MEYDKNYNLENLLALINGLLEPVEMDERKKAKDPKYPNLFLLGSSRCGSTMFIQWLVSTGLFSYPSNFLSRFYKAPFVGALIYEMLTNPQFQYRDEFCDINADISFKSSIGKTKGLKGPHEFWYFWREFMDFPDVPFTENEFTENFNFQDFQSALSMIQSVFGKPFILKAKIVNWYLESMNQNIDNALYLHMYREPIANIRSLLKAREKWTGSKENWFAWKPREYPKLIKMDKYHQVAGQIYFIEKEILSKKKQLGNKYLSFSYEELCNNPEKIYSYICNKVKDESSTFIIKKYEECNNFIISNPISEEDILIRDAWKHFNINYGELKY